MSELSDEELKKLPPAVREGFEKAKRKDKGLSDAYGDYDLSKLFESLRPDKEKRDKS